MFDELNQLWVHQTKLTYNWLPWVWPLLAAKWNGVSPLSFLGCRNTIRWMMVVTTGLENISTPKIFYPNFSSQTTIQILLFQPVWLKAKCNYLSIASTKTKYIKLNTKIQNIFCCLNENLMTFLYSLNRWGQENRRRGIFFF